MANDNTSTIQSYIDSATGTVQQALGNLTGSTGDENKGIAKQNKADVEHDLSHATAKGPGFTATTSGVARDDPDRQKGAWNQTVGAGKEFVGNVVGSEQLKRDGAQQNAEGKGQEAEGQLKDYGSGIADRVGGTFQNVGGAVLGDREAQVEGQHRHDQGKTLQRGAEHDISKQA